MSSEMAPCPKCRQLNSAASEECMFCDAPLPWSTNPAHRATAAAGYGVGGYGTAPIADPSGQGAVAMPRRYGYVEITDRYELWIIIVSFLMPIVGVGLYLKYMTSSPLRAKSAIYGLLPNIVFIGIIVVLRLLFSAANVPVTPH